MKSQCGARRPRILITGSADGFGRALAELASRSHRVVVHARSQQRLAAIQDLLDCAAVAVVGDLSDLEQTRSVADQANQIGRFDTVIHNAGVYSSREVLPVNVVARMC